jgi:hypothetical protein
LHPEPSFSCIGIGKIIERGKLSLESKVFDILNKIFPLMQKIYNRALNNPYIRIPDNYDENRRIILMISLLPYHV